MSRLVRACLLLIVLGSTPFTGWAQDGDDDEGQPTHTAWQIIRLDE